MEMWEGCVQWCKYRDLGVRVLYVECIYDNRGELIHNRTHMTRHIHVIFHPLECTLRMWRVECARFSILYWRYWLLRSIYGLWIYVESYRVSCDEIVCTIEKCLDVVESINRWSWNVISYTFGIKAYRIFWIKWKLWLAFLDIADSNSTFFMIIIDTDFTSYKHQVSKCS